MKNLFKKKANPEAPRPFDEIEKEYQQLSAQAANAQYKIFVHTEELKQVNKRLMQVNQEAGERQQLDQAVKEELAKAQQTPAPATNTQESNNG